jgi:membrane-bound lytic murein transglycosylase B
MQGCIRFLVLLLSISVAACASAPEAGREPASAGPLRHAIGKLREKGVPEDFLELVQKNYRESERARVLDLNLLGFLKTRPTQDERIPAWELERVQKFLRSNRHSFREAERKFGVPKEVVASLLWVETKYGRDVGTFHVASAYLSLMQADYPPILEQTIGVARERAKEFNREIEDKVVQRSQTKAAWALDEMLALQKVHEKGYKDAAKLEGSFSGAFGMAQFIPSSYLSWAKGRKKQPNLFTADDSIYSVANYLSVNGWEKKNAKAQEGALFHYNRDRDYVNRILRMSDCLRSPAKRKRWKIKRTVASVRSC